MTLVTEAIEFLSFKDWLGRSGDRTADWVVVACLWRRKPNDLYMNSVVASMEGGDESVRTLVDHFDWDVMTWFGNPCFDTMFGNEEMTFDPRDKEIVGEVTLSPFVISRYFHGYVPETFELVQSFLLYHNAFFVQGDETFQRVTTAGNIDIVARVVTEGDDRRIEVNRHHLRDYLAAHNAFLVRFHDHRRFSKIDISEKIDGQFTSTDFAGVHHNFQLWLRTDIGTKEHASVSRLLGKDVVLPYSSPDKDHVMSLNEKFAEFIVRRGDDGELHEEPSGPGNSLTPIYFRREVLAKYYDEPRRYSVEDSIVRCLDLWSIPIDINDEGLVQVWLVDLGRIPYLEQLNWKQFNVEPRGGITEHRFKRDLMAEFADPKDDPVFDLRRAFDRLQRSFQGREGEPLHRPLGELDQHNYAGLRLPLSEEWKEFDEIVQALAKLLVDSLNVPLLRRLTGLKIDGDRVKGSLDLLEELLTQVAGDEEAGRVTAPLRSIQALRSTGTAHVKGRNFEATLSKIGLAGLTRYQAVRQITADVARVLTEINTLTEEGALVAE